MKRLFAIILTIIIGISFIACKKDTNENATENLKNNFELTANIKYSGQEAVAKLTKNGENNFEVEMQSPSYLKGMVFTFDEEGTKISYMGMSINLEGDSLMASAVSKAVISSLNASISETGVELQSVDNTYILSGESESGPFELVLDKKTKNPVSLKIPTLNLECTFE